MLNRQPPNLMQSFGLACLLVFVLSQAAWSQKFSINQAKALFDQTTLEVNADLDLQLSKPVEEALHNGVSIRLTSQLDLYKSRPYWRDERLAQWSFNYDISYHSLTDRYVLSRPPLKESQSYSTLTALLRDVENFYFQSDILGDTLPSSQHGYKLQLRILLNKSALPAPLRVITYVKSGWRLKSAVHEWLIES